MTYYEECKNYCVEIQACYDALLEATTAYRDYLQRIRESEKNQGNADEKFFLVTGGQLNNVASFLELLETEALDRLIRFSDRVIIIKKWEEGTLV